MCVQILKKLPKYNRKWQGGREKKQITESEDNVKLDTTKTKICINKTSSD